LQFRVGGGFGGPFNHRRSIAAGRAKATPLFLRIDYRGAKIKLRVHF